MAKKLHLVHVKSNVLDKAPSASTLNYGEIAVNYNADSPALYIKDDDDNIVKFISEPYFEKIVGSGITENDGTTFVPISEVVQQDEEVTAAALNDLNDRKAEKTDVDEAISGITTYVEQAIANKADLAQVAITAVTQTGSGNVVTAATVANKVLTVAKGNITSPSEITEADIKNSTGTTTGLITGRRFKAAFDSYVDDQLDSASTNPVENRAIYEYVTENELVMAGAINDINVNKANVNQIIVTAVTQTGSGNVVTATTLENKVLTVAKGNITSPSEITEANIKNSTGSTTGLITGRRFKAAFDSYVDNQLDSASTNPVQNKVLYQVIHDNELVMAGAINNLDTTKADRTDLIGLANASDIIITAVTISGSGNVVTSTTLNNQVLTVGLGNIAGLPAVTSSDNGKILRVVNGAWALVDPVTIYSGNATPAQSLGNNGDVYLQTS